MERDLMTNYVAYHVHTEQSLLDSCTNYKDYVDKCVELGQEAIAFTEHGNLYTWVEKKLYCDEKGIKYIHGVEIYLTEQLDPKVRDNYHTILLAKNYEGVKEINRLCYNASKPDHFYYKPRISFDEFLNISDNVIKISACLASPLHECYRRQEERTDYSNFERLIDHYDYLEIQPHDFPKQKAYNTFLYRISTAHSKPLILGTDTHALNNYKAECRTIYQYAQEIVFNDEDSFDLTYKSYDELYGMIEPQNYLPKEVWIEAIENTNVMADSVESFELDKSFKYPDLYGDKDEEILWDRLRQKYKEKKAIGAIKVEESARYGEQIKEEMRVFKKLGMCGFMLFMSEIVSWCWENDIPTGFGRGSVCGSVVAYISDITDVDPIVWNTMFSRFCNEYRVELGDIDIDFPRDQREPVFKYMVDRFGIENTGYVFSNVTLQEKGAIEEIARGLNNKWKIANGYAIKDKVADIPYPPDVVTTIKGEYNINPEKTKKKYPELFYYMDGMNGVVKSASFHPAGMIVSPTNLIDNYGGVVKENGQTMLYINMEECHDVNLVKFDILGLRNIEIIRDTCRFANIPYPKSYQINFNDQEVWDNIITNPIGIFQMSSSFAFESLKRFKPSKLDDMTLVTAAIRPSGESYRDRLLNHEFNKNPSEQIDKLLEANNGFLVYQEDVIRFLQEVCGLNGSDADNIRRAIGAKDYNRLQKALPNILEGYCERSDKPREVTEQEAKEFLKIIEDAASYMFGRNHATAYSMIGFVCGMLRYYYPIEFVTSLLNNPESPEDTIDATSLAKELGMIIKAPKFGFANNKYTLNKESNTIYKGVGSIKDMQSVAADIMLEIASRNPTSFIDILFLTKEVKIDGKAINKTSLEILTKIGFFSEFGTVGDHLATIYFFNQYWKSKTIKKEKITEDWLLEIIKDCATKETDKQYSGIDNHKLIESIMNQIPHEEEDILALIKRQVEYLGYADVEESDISPNLYLVQSVKRDRYDRVWFKIYQFASNLTKEYQCDSDWYKKMPCKENDVIKVVFDTKPKCIKKEDSDKYIKTNELRTYIKFYSLTNK